MTYIPPGSDPDNSHGPAQNLDSNEPICQQYTHTPLPARPTAGQTDDPKTKNVVSLNSRLKTIPAQKPNQRTKHNNSEDSSIVPRLRRSPRILLMFTAHSDRVPITADARVLGARVLGGGLSLEHLGVLGDAVALALGDRVLAVEGLALGRGPGEVVAADLDVVVCELAELVVVHAEELGFLGRAQVQARDLVDDEGEQGAHGEGVGRYRDDVGDLLVDCFRTAG